MQDLEDRLKELGDRVSQETPSDLRPTPHALRRIRVGRAVRSGAVLATVAALVIGGFAAADLLAERNPVQPAEREEQQGPLPGTTANGRIFDTGKGQVWERDDAPPPPGKGQYHVLSYHVWNAFDQESGSFLYASLRSDRVWVLDGNGLIAEFVCPSPLDCDRMSAFGPGSDEVTVLGADLQSVKVLGFDGKLRDSLEIANLSGGDSYDGRQREISGLAWSPDGSRLAISTEPRYGCVPSSAPCDGEVWVLDRDDGELRSVLSEPPAEDLVEGKYPNNPLLRQPAWSPDGSSLALVAAPESFGFGANDGADPRLIVLRFLPDGQAREDTLHAYDAKDWRTEGLDALLASHLHLHFAFAWSPDGTRLAVTSEGGVTEISAEDGSVLARHSGVEVHGPLAWLPKQ